MRGYRADDEQLSSGKPTGVLQGEDGAAPKQKLTYSQAGGFANPTARQRQGKEVPSTLSLTLQSECHLEMAAIGQRNF